MEDGSPSLPPRPPPPRGAALGPAAAARLGAAAAAATRSSQPGQGSGTETAPQGASQLREQLLRQVGDSSPFGPQAQQQQPFFHGSVAGRSATHMHAERRRRTGKHPANLEHCSTEPPGAIDDLAELLLAAATLAGDRAAAAASSGMHSTDGSSRGSASAAPLTASQHLAFSSAPPGEERGPAPVRCSAPAAADPQPLLSSQVALLAQQLLLQQQQHGGGSGGGATQLRSSLEPPLGRSRTACADELLRARQGAPTAADMLRGLAGSGGSGPQIAVEATPVLQSLDAAHQPRFSGPAPLESPEQGSPFSAIQGEGGCRSAPCLRQA